MNSEELQPENVDETINLTAPIINFHVTHWTELKSSMYSCDYEMVFPKTSVPLEEYTGMVRTLSCCLASANMHGGDKPVSRLVHFDRNYLKFQIATLLRDVLFEIESNSEMGEDETQKQIEYLWELFKVAVADFGMAFDQCLNDTDIRKAIKPKNVTQHLKDTVYKL